MQRVRGGGNAARLVASLPALTGAWRHRAGGMLLSSSGMFPVDRAACSAPICWLGAPAHHQHEHHWRRLAARQLGRFWPAIEALVVYNSNPVAVAPESGKVVQGFARDDLFTVVLEHFRTDTADYADYILPATTQLEHWDVHMAYGHTDVLLNRPAIAPVGQARPNTQIFRDLARHMGLQDACLFDSDEDICRQAYGARVDFERAAGARPCHARPARRAVCRWRLSHTVGQMRILQRTAGPPGPGRPARLPAQPRAGRQQHALPAGHDLAAGAQLPQLQFRQRDQPAQHRRRARAGDPCGGRCRARH
jgi:hypothetical protein